MRFDELELEDELLDGLYDMNFQEMTPVQEHTIPVILEGRDIIGCAQTGTGKTAAYTLPLLNKLLVEGVNVATCHVKAVSGIMGIIADSLDSIEIYTLGGIRIADTTDLVPGFYIVRYVRDGVTVTEKKRF